MKKIFVQTPYSRDPNSFWRCLGPLSYMSKHSDGEIEIYIPPDGQVIAWDVLDKFDLVFMHRPCRKQDMIVLRIAKSLNIPVWSDFDDWLFHLPAWNRGVSVYHQPEIQENIAAMIACSDVLTVSTTALLEQFSRINTQTVLIPNAYRSDLFSFREKTPPPRKSNFLWRGSDTHDGDLLSVADAFTKLSQKVQFLGGPAYSVLSQMKPESYQRLGDVDPLMYWKMIYQYAPKVWLFPLDDCFFNHCKSNISWIEATHAGAITVAPHMPEWRHPGVISYEAGNSESFLQASEEAMSLETGKYSQIMEDAFEYMKSKYDITIVNALRTALFMSIFNPSFERNKRDAFNQLTGTWALSVLKGEPLSTLPKETA